MVNKKESNKQCEVCNFDNLPIYSHHKDGNLTNNKPSNVLKVCSKCYKAIHKGVKKNTRTDYISLFDAEGNSILSTIGKWRFYLLKRKGYKLKEIEDDYSIKMYLLEVQMKKTVEQFSTILNKFPEIYYS